MTNEIDPSTQVGVVIGRFQVAELTQGHKELLDYVLSRGFGTNVLILGLSPLKCTTANPLDYEARRLMIEQAYPCKFDIHYIKDCNSDLVWSKNLDEMLDDIRANRSVVLIGSRDCFLDHYLGKYKNNFEEYTQKTFVSGTEQRKALSKKIKATPEWRAGIVYSTQNRYPTVYSTVDCAIFENDQLDKIYLARKQNESCFRFVGGFTDPKDDSFEAAAKREAQEETGIDELEVLSYVCSQKILDWRYQNEVDKIITHLFVLTKTFGRVKLDHPECDIAEVKLFEFDKLYPYNIMPEHQQLFIKLQAWRENYLKTHISIAKEVEKQMG